MKTSQLYATILSMKDKMIEEGDMDVTNFRRANCAVDEEIADEISKIMKEFKPELAVFKDEHEFRSCHIQWR